MKQYNKNPKNYLVSGRVNKEVFVGLKRYGNILNLGTGNGDCVLTSIGATIIFITLKEVENNLKNVGKSFEDLLQIKDSYFYKWTASPLFDVLRKEEVINSLPDEIMMMVMKMSHSDKVKGGLQEND